MPGFATRSRWHNVEKTERADPLRTYRPDSPEQVAEIVRAARDSGDTVRAAGSRHSWSDVACASGFLIAPDRMRAPLDLEAELLRRSPQGLVRVQAGMRIRELNDHLAARGLGLANMGGYDGQTIAGVTSTSTHGSGRDCGPLHAALRSLDLVAGGGVLLRVEPAEGPTDPDRWVARHPEHRLVQDDETWAAAVVGLGCLGVICAVILEAVPAYRLRERRTETTWEQERDRIPTALGEHAHYELLLSPYADKSGHPCMVTTRDPYDGPLPPWWSSARRRNIVAETLSGLPGTGQALRLFAALFPAAVPWALRTTLHALADDAYIARSDRVFNIGVANHLPATSMEIAVPVDDAGTHVAAVERVLAVAARARASGRVYHTAPIALRFVAESPALLSMMHGRPLSMTLELILLRGSYGGRELLAAYEDALRPLGGRPHWGQVNHLTEADVEALYPASLARWRAVRDELDPDGTFGGRCAARLGLTRTATRTLA